MTSDTNNCNCGSSEHTGADNCCHSRKHMQRFMETCLLVLLNEQDGHGYHLTEQLKGFGFEDVNVSTLYRIMRKMEGSGWVTSNWEKGDKGPQKRVYSITPEGKSALKEWVEIFKQRKANIELMLSRYRSITED